MGVVALLFVFYVYCFVFYMTCLINFIEKKNVVIHRNIPI